MNRWLNEGTRDMARKTRCLWEKTSIDVFAGAQQYAAPDNFLEHHRSEFLPEGSINVYPLDFRNYSEMDSIWGINQQIQQFYPNYITLWREPPNTFFVLFPVPSAAGTLRVQYFRNSKPATSDDQTLDVPEGFHDVAVLYALYTALFQSLDPRWAEVRQLYNEQLAELAATASGWTDSVGSFTMGMPSSPVWSWGGADLWA